MFAIEQAVAQLAYEKTDLQPRQALKKAMQKQKQPTAAANDDTEPKVSVACTMPSTKAGLFVNEDILEEIKKVQYARDTKKETKDDRDELKVVNVTDESALVQPILKAFVLHMNQISSSAASYGLGWKTMDSNELKLLAKVHMNGRGKSKDLNSKTKLHSFIVAFLDIPNNITFLRARVVT